MAESLQSILSRHRAAAWDCAQPNVILFRVEVWDGGVLLEARTFPNSTCARIFAEHQKAWGFRALLMYPRAETP
jgi:hypothetical protein